MESDIKVQRPLGLAANTTAGPPHSSIFTAIMSTKRRKTSDEPSALKKAAAPSAPGLKKEKKVKTKKAEKTEEKQDAPEPTEQSNSTEEDSATLDNAPEQEETEIVKKSFKDLVCLHQLSIWFIPVVAIVLTSVLLHRESWTPSAKLAIVSDTRTRPPFKNSRFL